MKTFLQDGDVLSLVAPSGGVISGQGYLFGQMFVVAVTSAAEGETFSARRKGAFRLPKLSAQAWTVGQRIYWDNTNKWCTTVNTSNVPIGSAIAVADNPSATGDLVLNEATAATAS